MTRKDFELISGVDPVAASNARQSEFYARADREGTNDRADVTSGSGYSRYDYEGGAE